MSPSDASTTWRVGTACLTCGSVLAKFSTMTIAFAPESFSWCSSSRGV